MAVLLFSFLVVVLSSGAAMPMRGGRPPWMDVVPDVCGPYARGGTRLPDRAGEAGEPT